MREYDFIFVYEHKTRELETLCLLKCELEKRKYSVQLLGLNSFEFYKSHNAICKFKYYARVLVVFACYNINTLRMCVQQIVKFDKVINLQWEQMISKRQERVGSVRNFTDIGKSVVHIAWGEANLQRLLNVAKVDEKKVFKCGNAALDFLTPRFDDYYYDKKRICKIYNIPANMKICTIFANFRGADMNEEQVEKRRKKMGDGWVEVQKVGKKVKRIVLQWLERAASEYPNIFFVYRPHPGENTAEVESILDKYNNVGIIGELSSKQWIRISDCMFTWHSTVAIESRIANRPCVLIEPNNCQVPTEEDSIIFEDVVGISDYTEFAECLSGKVIENSISDNLVKAYFGENYKESSYKNVANAFEVVYKEDYYLLAEQIEKYRVYELDANARSRMGVYRIVDELVWRYLGLCSFLQINSNSESVKEYQFVRKREKIECASSKEIRKVCRKIKKII